MDRSFVIHKCAFRRRYVFSLCEAGARTSLPPRWAVAQDSVGLDSVGFEMGESFGAERPTWETPSFLFFFRRLFEPPGVL